MPFDPKAYLAEGGSGGFDPKAYLSDGFESPRPAPPVASDRGGQAMLENYGNTATMGYLSQLQAATSIDPNSALDEKLRSEGFTLDQPDSGYLAERDANSRRREELTRAHPGYSAVGTGLGIAASAVMGSGLGAAKAAPTLLGRVAQGAKTGAVLGAVQNPGDVEGELSPLQLGDRIKNAGTGALFGGATSGVLEGGANLSKHAKNRLAAMAEESAFKSLGPYAREAKRNYAKGKINEVGRELLDESVITFRPSSYETIAKRAAVKKDEAGKRVGSVIDELAEVENNVAGRTGESTAVIPKGAKLNNAGVSRKAIADDLEKELLSGKSLFEKDDRKFRGLIKSFLKEHDELIPLKNAQALKVELNKKINWKRAPDADIPLEEQFYRALYKKLNKGVDDAADALANIKGGDAPVRLAKAKKSYGAMSEAEGIANNREARERANRFLSPSDYFTGGLGAMAGVASGDSIEDKIINGLTGASLAGANKFSRQYGNQIKAKSADALSRKAGSIQSLLTHNPSLHKAAQAGVNRAKGESSFLPLELQPHLNDPEFLRMISENPGLLDSIQDDRLRAQIKARLERMPASKSQLRLKALEE